MKKIISTKGFLNGQYGDSYLDIAIHERVNNKLKHLFNMEELLEGEVHVDSKLSYEVRDGEVISIQLSYTIDNPTPRRLEDFRSACEWFYELHGFKIEDKSDIPHIVFDATDLFDMASLIHALDYQTVSLEGVLCPIDSSLTAVDAIYSPSGSYIIQIPDIAHYKIKEGTHFISSGAIRHCKNLRKLEIPESLNDFHEVLCDYPYPLTITIWNGHYEAATDEDESEEGKVTTAYDKHHVGYSEDGKILKFCNCHFNKTKYEVPNGVEQIEDFAFLSCRHPL